MSITKEQMEAKPEWRATILRRNRTAFIMERSGKYKGRFYEYPEGAHPTRYEEVDPKTLHGEISSKTLKVLKGALPEL